MSADRDCLVCREPMPAHDNSPACENCWGRLERDLAQMPTLVEELQVTLARLDRITRNPARRPTDPDDDADDVDAAARDASGRDIPPWLRAEHQPRIKARALPLRLEASNELVALHDQVLRIVGPVLAEHPACRPHLLEGPAPRGKAWPLTFVPLPAPRPLSDTTAASRFLLRALPWMRTRPDQHGAIRAIGRAVTHARDLIDTAPDVVYCGICSTTTTREVTAGCPGPDQCPCGCHDGYGNPCTIPGGCGLPTLETVTCEQELYAVDHRHLTKRRHVDGRDEVVEHVCMQCAFVRCRTCGTSHDVKERRHALLEAARDYLVTTTEACRAIATYADGNLKEATVWKWKERGRVIARGHTVDNGTRQDLFRLGDLMDLATETRRSNTREGA